MPTDSSSKQARRRMTAVVALTAAVVALGAIAITALLVNRSERKSESRPAFYRVVALNDDTADPAIWGKNFPLQYEGYARSVDQIRTRYGGSEAVPRTPAEAAKSTVAVARLEDDPRLKTMWAGYPLTKDARAERSHATLLTDPRQAGMCLNCHASMWIPYRRAGAGDIWKGFEVINKTSHADARKLVTHPVACIDCHDPNTMALRVTRPAFIEGLRALRNDPKYDPNAKASRQEMRSWVCGQCHVEYYFRSSDSRLVYPWQKGLSGDQILDYYETTGQHADWTHAESSAKVLKAQHPQFEMYSAGLHARSGAGCPDCHMPSRRGGAAEITDHHLQSPLLNVHGACAGCHRAANDEMKARVEQIQQRHGQMRNVALDALIALIADIRSSSVAGTAPALIEQAQKYQRKAQFLLDFVEAEGSNGFHAPQEAARLMTLSVDYSRRGQMALRRK